MLPLWVGCVEGAQGSTAQGGIWVSGCGQKQCGAALHKRRSLGRYRLFPMATFLAFRCCCRSQSAGWALYPSAEGKSSEGQKGTAWEAPHSLQWDMRAHAYGVVPRKGPGGTILRCGKQTKILLHGFLCFSMEIQVRITQDTACPFV